MESSLIIHLNFQKFVSEEESDFYFGSIASAYNYFTSEEIGCSKETLYKHFKNNSNAVYITPNCIIKKRRIIRKKRTN